MQRTRLAKWLVFGALALGAMFVGAQTASAQEATPSPSPEVQAASTGDGSTVQSGNTSSDAEAESGAAESVNDAVVSAGPSSSGGQASQIGNNTVRVDQSSQAKSGDAVAGSQVTGVVGGNATIQNQNSSTGAVAISGDAFAENFADVIAGPGSTFFGGAQQIGNNNVRVTQTSVAETGSAVAGSQVTGIVGGGDSTVQGQNFSDAPFAFSGDAFAINDAFVEAGPFADDGMAGQIGHNDAVLRQSSSAQSGDALAGAQVTGLVGAGGTVQNQNSSLFPDAFSGDAFAENFAVVRAGPESLGFFGPAQASQNGNNDVLAIQEANATSGDAVAGSQVTGLVSQERGNLTVQNQQASDAPFAESGFADAVNDLFVAAGPTADAFDAAQASQIGNTRVTVAQLAEATTGDALAGAQVVGAVGGRDVTVQSQNTSFDAFAFSGDAFAENVLDVFAGPDAFADFTASASQTGNNTVNVAQEALATTGDAVAGSAVFGVVGGRDVVIQAQNFADFPEAISGDAFAENIADVFAGPDAASGLDTAMASQIGDNRATFDQVALAASGDAVAGSQVAGLVGARGATVQIQNTSFDAVAETGFADAFNDAFLIAGPSASGSFGVASASQVGSNTAELAQLAGASSGDAVSGSQVVGAVGGRDNTIQGTNFSDFDFAFSADADAFNFAAGGAGPFADASLGDSTVSQSGDNRGRLDQEALADSGDAVSGGQVFGVA